MYPYNLSNKYPNDEKKSQLQMAAYESNNDLNQKILEMLSMAMANEKSDGNYYLQLAQKINDEDDKKIVKQMSLDEQKHYKYLDKIYKQISDMQPEIESIAKDVSDNLLDDFSNSMLEELDTVEFYRYLLFLFLDLNIRDMIYEIITDEQAHATKMNYMYSKYANAKS